MRTDTEHTCHCGADYVGSDHCPECGCEQYESGDCGHTVARSGADAKRGDLVRNLSTGQIAYVVTTLSSGRLGISSTPDGLSRLDKWERWNVEIIGTQEQLV